jgi:F0F1-type ATP synthase assembly protein I
MSIYKELAPYLALGTQMAVTVCLLGLGGWWFDRSMNTSPIGLILGLLFGSTVGLVQFFRSVGQLSRKPPEE